MNAFEAIREVMKRRGYKMNALADALGISQSTAGMRLRQKTISTDKTSEMLRVMGYKLVAVPVDAKDLRDAIRIEES